MENHILIKEAAAEPENDNMQQNIHSVIVLY